MVYLLNEDGNRYLKGRRFMPSEGIVKRLQNNLDNFKGSKSDAGYDRLNNLITMCKENGGIAYNEMKRLKNWFDTHRTAKGTNEYELIGGEIMDRWVSNKLESASIAAANMAKSQKEIDKLKPSARTNIKRIKPMVKSDGKSVMDYLKELN